ncbi:dihydrofolate reductase family protein [Millisia brevis]|uniref:dihydrofolate reductase family protein n=1 Tax=Millisia brevis TaxID=264148 RepID=UPI000AEEE0C2|nr:dihydrofolate reductase family protein [Millisia brevis]
MPPVVATMSVSLDGIGAGHNQTEERPFGDIPEGILHRWMFEAPDENRAEMAALIDAGAFVMGRNMFGPIRGEWSGDWNGWWGPEPPYHAPVFVLTHHPRESLTMAGGTTFHFVTEGIDVALERARAAAGDREVHIAGGPTTVNAYLAAGAIDELRLQIAPVALGVGVRLFDGLPPIELEQLDVRPTSLTTHVHYRVRRTPVA